MAVPSRNPVRRRIALRCIRRSRFKDVLGDGPTRDCPDAYSFASCNGNMHREIGSRALPGLPSSHYDLHGTAGHCSAAADCSIYLHG